MIWLLALGFGAITAYELWSAITHGGLTISQWTWRLAAQHPLVPFLVGVLMGHLFWQR